MELKLQNINKIKEASIRIGGLTLIAGENDSGKSTVGKVLFSVVKALSRQSEDLEESKEKKIHSLIEHLFFMIRRSERVAIKWQLHFAHLLVKLVKNNIPVVVSSHSPYFIQAVKYYSTQEDVASKVDYYLADTDTEDTDMTRIVDVSEDLNKIFIKLAEPLNEMLRG